MSLRAPPSLARRFAVLVSLALFGVWALSVLAMGIVLQGEETEFYDEHLATSARAFLSVVDVPDDADLLAPPGAAAPDDATNPNTEVIYRLVDRSGRVLSMSEGAEGAQFPPQLRPASFQRTATHMVYTSGFNDRGHAVQFADPLAERREAWRESFLAFMLPMLMILPLGFLAMRWVTGLALRPLDAVRAEMAARDAQDLTPIEPQTRPVELADMIATLNGFMGRLSQALDGERAFASNAAHELRTPVAVALAQVQRLETEARSQSERDSLHAVHAALLRMSRLVARLLQLARADAGIGPAAAPVDLTRVLPHVLHEIEAEARARLHTELPEAPLLVALDADAFAIIAGNLIENALQHSPPLSPVTLRLSAQEGLVVRNEGAPLAPETLAKLTSRFARRDSGGFGLGLHIASQIARQAGMALEIRSPAPGRDSGVEARLRLP
ncbi:HAMP domain-containing protein [Thioclava sp. BHET1]|nr:HAMP domain-containing protein [Thioclava sp. BHET1]